MEPLRQRQLVPGIRPSLPLSPSLSLSPYPYLPIYLYGLQHVEPLRRRQLVPGIRPSLPLSPSLSLSPYPYLPIYLYGLKHVEPLRQRQLVPGTLVPHIGACAREPVFRGVRTRFHFANLRPAPGIPPASSSPPRLRTSVCRAVKQTRRRARPPSPTQRKHTNLWARSPLASAGPLHRGHVPLERVCGGGWGWGWGWGWGRPVRLLHREHVAPVPGLSARPQRPHPPSPRLPRRPVGSPTGSQRPPLIPRPRRRRRHPLAVCRPSSIDVRTPNKSSSGLPKRTRGALSASPAAPQHTRWRPMRRLWGCPPGLRRACATSEHLWWWSDSKAVGSQELYDPQALWADQGGEADSSSSSSSSNSNSSSSSNCPFCIVTLMLRAASLGGSRR